ncbi:MAG: hypothetical protein AB7E72_02215 [Lysobacterales bacterium]
MTIAAVYDASYGCGGMAHFARLPALHSAAQELPGLSWSAPEHGRALNLLPDLHAPAYVKSFLSGEHPLARSNYLAWSPALRKGVIAMLDGQLTAAQLAFDQGIAFNLAIGFHHAHPEHGGGFCTFNGLALVALVHPSCKITVLDSDEHGSDGTEAFCELLPNLSNLSLFGTRFGVRGGVRSRALQIPRGESARAGFRTAIEQAMEMIIADPPDLLIFQAGADSHESDPKSSLHLGTEDLLWRDLCVFHMCRRMQLPVLANFAGAYQDANASSNLYLNTLKSAVTAYSAAN